MYMSRFKSPLQVVTKLTAAGFKEWEKAKFAPEVRGPRKFGCLILMACPVALLPYLMPMLPYIYVIIMVT